MSRDNRRFRASNEFQPGSQPPEGYLAKQEWAQAQLQAGLKQSQCRHCGLWHFPQTVDGHLDRYGISCAGGKNI